MKVQIDSSPRQHHEGQFFRLRTCHADYQATEILMRFFDPLLPLINTSIQNKQKIALFASCLDSSNAESPIKTSRSNLIVTQYIMSAIPNNEKWLRHRSTDQEAARALDIATAWLHDIDTIEENWKEEKKAD